MSTGPSAPANSAAAAAPASVNKHRLLRFTRPFVASSKKGAQTGVPPRKWRPDDERTGGALATAALVDELVSKLSPAEVARALAHQEPIASTSAEAALLRSQRFQTAGVATATAAEPLAKTPDAAEDPAVAARRLNRFGATLATDAAGSGAVVAAPVDPAVAAQRRARFGETLAAPVAAAAVAADVPPEVASRRASRFAGAGAATAAPATAPSAPASEEEQKRLRRFG
jgi:hypothetical protein